MESRQNEYTRLSGGRWTSMTRTSLWLGPDHLLKISSSGGYAEDYRRYYYKDIQAITVMATQRGFFWNVMLILLLILFVGIGGIIGNTFGMVFAAVSGGVFGFLLLLNLLLGDTCACSIRTAVQSDKLNSLRRVRTARRIIAILREKIIAAQGGFTDEDQAVMAALAHPPGPKRITLPEEAFIATEATRQTETPGTYEASEEPRAPAQQAEE